MKAGWFSVNPPAFFLFEDKMKRVPYGKNKKLKAYDSK
jgi:hypothetical protein